MYHTYDGFEVRVVAPDRKRFRGEFLDARAEQTEPARPDMRRAAALALLLALSGHAAFLAPPKGRPGGKSKAKKASPRKVPAGRPQGRKAGVKPDAAELVTNWLGTLPSLPSLPSPQELRDLPGELRERAEEARDSLPQNPEEAKEAALDALTWVGEEVRIGQVLFGFAAAVVFFTGGLVSTGRAFGDYLSTDGRGEVCKQSVLLPLLSQCRSRCSHPWPQCPSPCPAPGRAARAAVRRHPRLYSRVVRRGQRRCRPALPDGRQRHAPVA